MSKKKQIRSKFRESVFNRDGHKCRCCGKDGYSRQGEPVEGKIPLDAHHVENRNKFENGGYVTANGISVCDDCHLLAEVYHDTGTAHEGFHPNELYAMIGSSFEKAKYVDRKNK